MKARLTRHDRIHSYVANKTPVRFLFAVAAVLFPAVPALAFVPEPETILYGQVIQRDGQYKIPATEGRLTWTLLDSDGGERGFSTEMGSLGDGRFSYRMGIPHQALAAGIEVDAEHLALGYDPETYTNVTIAVDGRPARLVSRNGGEVNVFQRARSATHRIDLEVDFDMTDSSGDGIPDWWKRHHGLNPDDWDANTDFSGDGITALEAYEEGLDPWVDSNDPVAICIAVAETEVSRRPGRVIPVTIHFDEVPPEDGEAVSFSFGGTAEREKHYTVVGELWDEERLSYETVAIEGDEIPFLAAPGDTSLDLAVVILPTDDMESTHSLSITIPSNDPTNPEQAGCGVEIALLGYSETFEEWIAERLGVLPDAPSELALHTNEYGIVHLLDYAFPGDASEGIRPPRVFVRDDLLHAVFDYNVAATDLRYVVEVSPELEFWVPAEGFLEPVTLPEYDAGNVRAFRALETVDVTEWRFVRVRVELVNP